MNVAVDLSELALIQLYVEYSLVTTSKRIKIRILITLFDV